MVLVVGLHENDVGVRGHDGFGDAPVHGESVGAVVHDAGVVVVFADVAPVRVLVKGVRIPWRWIGELVISE